MGIEHGLYLCVLRKHVEWKNLWEKTCGKKLVEKLVGKNLWEKTCGKKLVEKLVEKRTIYKD
jgi:hypothetical protein